MISFVRIRSFAPLKEAVISGAPIFVFMIMTIIKSFGLNEIIIRFIGEGGMAVYTVCDNVLMIVEMITAGIIGVIPNIAGILYGEKDYFGIRALCKRVLVLSAAATLCIFVLVMVFLRSHRHDIRLISTYAMINTELFYLSGFIKLILYR